MTNVIIRHVTEQYLDACYAVESVCYTSDAATRGKIQKRIELFPEGFLVAELYGRIIGMINSGSTNKEDITDEAFKAYIDHVKDGRNIVIFFFSRPTGISGKRGFQKSSCQNFWEYQKDLKRKNRFDLQI